MTATRISHFALMIAIALCTSMSPIFAQSGILTNLHTLVYDNDGAYPYAGLIQAKDGNFYGTTEIGGTYPGGHSGYGYGTVFKITPSGQFAVLHTFGFYNGNPAQTDGFDPSAGLVQGRDGNLYGTTWGGGYYGPGTIFKLTLAGAETVLHSFSNDTVNGNTDGAWPLCTLVQGANGDLYGTASFGGQYNMGTIFKVSPSGQFTLLHAFSGHNSTNPILSDGKMPQSGLVLGRDGNFYGTTTYGGQFDGGTIYRITPKGVLTVLYSFGYESDPVDLLIQGRDGNLYGLLEGFASDFFRITPDGTFTDLGDPGNFEFGAGYSTSGLVQANDGNFYGTTWSEGVYGRGAVYQITPSGAGTIIYSFTGGTDGFWPSMPLIQGSDGNFYGMTYEGTETAFGTIFRLHYLDPVPTLTQLSPSTLPTGGPAFTLTVSGKNFAADASVNWNGAPLTTAFVSANKLTAAVPASAIAAAGTASVTVTNPMPGGGTTVALTFTVTVTSLSVKVGKLTRDSTTGAITVSLTLKNTGYAGAPNLMITSATLSQAGTTAALLVNLGTLAAGALTATSLTFPGSAGASGTSATLTVSGTYTGGTFSYTKKAVRLP